jgi:hypothetical protein
LANIPGFKQFAAKLPTKAVRIDVFQRDLSFGLFNLAVDTETCGHNTPSF